RHQAHWCTRPSAARGYARLSRVGSGIWTWTGRLMQIADATMAVNPARVEAARITCVLRAFSRVPLRLGRALRAWCRAAVCRAQPLGGACAKGILKKAGKGGWR